MLGVSADSCAGLADGFVAVFDCVLIGGTAACAAGSRNCPRGTVLGERLRSTSSSKEDDLVGRDAAGFGCVSRASLTLLSQHSWDTPYGGDIVEGKIGQHKDDWTRQQEFVG